MCAPEDKIGIITEQGDLGLGFDPISDEYQNEIEENFNKIVKSDKEDN